MIFFWILVLVGIFLRIQTLDIPLYDDAGSMILNEYHDSIFANIVLYPHGPINTIFFVLGMKLFGATTVGLRLTLCILSMLYLVAVYFFTRDILSEKSARYAVLLNLFTFFAFFTYFTMESDGIMQSLFSVIAFYALFLYFKSKKQGMRVPMIIVSIASYVLLVAMKHRNGIFIIPLFLYILYETKTLKKAIAYSITYVTSAVVIAGSFFLLFYPLYGELAPHLLEVVFSHNTVDLGLLYKITHPALFSTLIIGLTPLLLLLPLLTLQKKDGIDRRKYIILYVWLTVPLLFIFLVPPGLSIIKYVAGFLLPPITILAADVLAREKWKKYTLTTIAMGTMILSSIGMYINNTIPKDYWFFLTEMGPVIKVWQPFIYITFFLGIVLFGILWYKKERGVRTIVFTAFLILTLSFNLLMITDNLVDKTHNEMIKEIQDYAEEQGGINTEAFGRLYAWNEDIAFYLGNPGFYIVPEGEPHFGLEFDKNEQVREYSRSTGLGEQGYIDLSLPQEEMEKWLKAEPGTVILLNYPYKYVVEASPEIQDKIALIDSLCTKEKESIFKTASLLIYKCPSIDSQ